MRKLIIIALALISIEMTAAEPLEIGKKLSNLFLTTEPEYYNPDGYSEQEMKAYNGHYGYNKNVHYAVVSYWVNCLEFARLSGDKALEEALIAKFEPFFGAKQKLCNRRNHVDHTIFGALPLEIYLLNGDERCLKLGLEYAEAQWSEPDPKDCGGAGNPDYDTQLKYYKDGYTPQTRVWIDDMYMINVLQTQAFRATGDYKYIDRAAREMVLYLDKIQNEDGLFYHAVGKNFIWGRGDGWMAAGMPMILKYLRPSDPKFGRIMTGYRKMMAALLYWQRENGLWGQLVNDVDSWEETSCSAMFTYGMLEGVNNGWLDKTKYGAAANRAWEALCNKLDEKGHLKGICVGTGARTERDWYMKRPTINGDPHGQAPMMWICNAKLFKGYVNYDKSKAVTYPLQDPLTFKDGKKVRSAKDWKARRSEILDIFQTEMYGKFPPKPETLVCETIEEGVTLAGYGIRKQVRMWFKSDKTGPSIDWLIVYPRFAKGPVPALISLNYRGNQTILGDPEVTYPKGCWMRKTSSPHKNSFYTDGSDRGLYDGQQGNSIYPLQMILARGYAFVTASYIDVSPDPSVEDDRTQELQRKLSYTGVFDLWAPRDESRKDNITSLGAWAWALSRGLDMLEKDERVDAKKVVVTGCSRLGKAALLAGVSDERFAVTAPVQTGGGGVPLHKHFYGENTHTMSRTFTHWYCRNYDKYCDREADMPFDQHMLLSCVAPRGLLVMGFDEPWFDTEGEYLAVKAASPVWKLLGGKGMPAVSWPEDYDTSAIGPDLGYVRRSQAHGIAAYDWTWMLDFSDRIFSK